MTDEEILAEVLEHFHRFVRGMKSSYRASEGVIETLATIAGMPDVAKGSKRRVRQMSRGLDELAKNIRHLQRARGDDREEPVRLFSKLVH